MIHSTAAADPKQPFGSLLRKSNVDETQYRTALSQVFSEHLEIAANRLVETIRHLPIKTRAMNIEVFPDQDGEGTFTIRVGLDGPDLYVLNKAIDEWADLFDVRLTRTGLEPAVPLMEPGAESFDVNDAIVDCSARWLQQVWESIDNPQLDVPVTVVGHEGYGTVTPLVLHR